jgi:hypothetical protein
MKVLQHRLLCINYQIQNGQFFMNPEKKIRIIFVSEIRKNIEQKLLIFYELFTIISCLEIPLFGTFMFSTHKK